ncbi:hypothetical protein CI102_2751 [Trichoderma harzianum]|nr:hypothetical protein CI102_2751 [Trichoderma harzianum]
MPSRKNRDSLCDRRVRVRPITLETQIEKHKTGTHAHLPETSQSHRSTAEYCITHIVNCLIIIGPCLIYTLVQLHQRETPHKNSGIKITPYYWLMCSTLN